MHHFLQEFPTRKALQQSLVEAVKNNTSQLARQGPQTQFIALRFGRAYAARSSEGQNQISVDASLANAG